MHGACGTAGWAPPILHPHQELVAALPLSVQGLEGGYFSWECRRGVMYGTARGAKPEAWNREAGVWGAWEANPG